MSRGATRTFHSRGAGLALLVDGQRDDGRAVLADERHHPRVAGVGAVAVLEVDRVDDAAAAEHLQAGLDHVRLGRVEHDRQGGRGGEPAGELAHVLRAVAADVVDAQVEQVRAVAGLLAGDLDAVLRSRRRASRRGTPWSRWRWCARRPSARWRPARTARGGRATTRRARSPARAPPARRRASRRRRPADVLGRGAAAAADQRRAVLVDERAAAPRPARPGSAGRPRRPAVSCGRPALGMTDSGTRGVLRQVPQVLAHLGRAGGAVEPDQVDAQRLERGQRRADLAAEQHRAGGLDGDLADQRHGRARPRPSPAWRRSPPPWPAAGPGRSRRSARRRRRRSGRRRCRGRRRAAWRTARAPGSAAWCPGRSSRARTGAARRWSSGRPLAGQAGAGLGELADPALDPEQYVVGAGIRIVRTAIAPTTSSHNGSTPKPGIASKASPGNSSHCRPSTMNSNSAVARSTTHTIGGKGVVKAPMASEMAAMAKAMASCFLENSRTLRSCRPCGGRLFAWFLRR